MSTMYTLLMAGNSVNLEFFVKVWEGDLSQPIKIPNGRAYYIMLKLPLWISGYAWCNKDFIQNVLDATGLALSSDIWWHSIKEERSRMHILWDCPTVRQQWKEVDTRVKINDLLQKPKNSAKNYILGYLSAKLGLNPHTKRLLFLRATMTTKFMMS